MTKRKGMTIGLIALGVLIIIGAVLSVYWLTRDKRVIEVDLDAEDAQVVKFDDLCLLPGESSGYTLSFSGEYSKEYNVKLRFGDMAPEQALKHYARLRLEQDGEVLYDELLSDTFEGDAIKLKMKLIGKTQDIEVRFYLPADVGNEAQGAEADFELLITAETY